MYRSPDPFAIPSGVIFSGCPPGPVERLRTPRVRVLWKRASAGANGSPQWLKRCWTAEWIPVRSANDL